MEFEATAMIWEKHIQNIDRKDVSVHANFIAALFQITV
jgi:hypothetical protein